MMEKGPVLLLSQGAKETQGILELWKVRRSGFDGFEHMAQKEGSRLQEKVVSTARLSQLKSNGMTMSGYVL